MNRIREDVEKSAINLLEKFENVILENKVKFGALMHAIDLLMVHASHSFFGAIADRKIQIENFEPFCRAQLKITIRKLMSIANKYDFDNRRVLALEQSVERLWKE